MNVSTIYGIPVLLLLLPCALPAHAAPAVRKDRSNLPITIKSNELSADNKGKVAVFSGKVVARQGDITIYSDRLTVNYGEKKGEVENIDADGSVRIIHENRTGSAGHAVYDSRAGRVTLTGNAKVTQGADSISGSTITYFVDEDRSVVSGGEGGRVEAVITPPARGGSGAPR